MVDELILRKWLLDKQKLLVVQLLEYRNIYQCVSGVRIDLEGQIGERFPHRLNLNHISPRFELYLYPPVARFVCWT